MNKIFITGAHGFVGRKLVHFLKEKNISFVAGVRLAKQENEVSYGDLTTVQNWDELLKDCDSVIHLAARVHVMTDQHQNPLEVYLKTNTESTLNLARAAKKNGVKKFIFLSTIKINGEKTEIDQAFHADDQVQPEDPYSISKFQAEQKLLELHKINEFEVTIIRPPLVYGPGVKGNLKSLMKLVNLQLPLPFLLVRNKRSLVSVYNLCDLILTCLQKPQAAGQIFLASDGNDLSLNELIQKFARVLGKKTFLLPIPVSWMFFFARLLGQSNYANRLLGNLQVDISKAKSLLNWSPPFSFEETYLKKDFDSH